MSADRKIKEALEQIVAVHLKDKVMFTFCNVKSVDLSSTTCICTPIGEDATVDITGVDMQADVSDGELKVPVVGSTVIVGYSIRNTPFLAFVSDIDAYYYQGNTWQQGDGTFGGWVKVISLVTKLNALENRVNDLIAKYNAHVHSGVTTGGGVSGVTTTPDTDGSITPTIRSDIENNKATHGV